MGLVSFFRALRDSSPSAAKARAAATHFRIGQLTIAEAERRARDRILKRDPFRTSEATPSGVEAERLATLPDELRSLLRTYREIEAGGMRIERTEIGAYNRRPEWVQIGTDLEHAAIVARPTDGYIFVIEDDGSAELDLVDEYPSIWHYLLEVAENTTGREYDQPSDGR